jgi:ABC-2 type transport system ATP-binding protein
MDQPAVMPAIETRDLVKRYGRTTALSGLTMSVPRGEVFGFLGPNGAGKTTAVKVLLGLVSASAGEAFVLGRPAGDLETRRKLGYLPELFRYQAWLTGRELLRLHADLVGLDGDRRKAADAAIEMVGLTGRRDDAVGGYSKGMQQRLGLGVALIGAPEVVFLDEPTSALDPVARMELRPIIRGLRDRGMTVFLNSHLLTEVEQVCDRVGIVARGQLIAVGTLEDLLVEPIVRLRVGELGAEQRAALEAFGQLADDGDWLVVRGLRSERVPELVAMLVAGGVQVYAVEPMRESLESRFRALVGSGDVA